jgi:hypothetical protein
MADAKAPPGPDPPWRDAPPTEDLFNALWFEGDYNRMELEAFVEKRS